MSLPMSQPSSSNPRLGTRTLRDSLEGCHWETQTNAELYLPVPWLLQSSHQCRGLRSGSPRPRRSANDLSGPRLASAELEKTHLLLARCRSSPRVCKNTLSCFMDAGHAGPCDHLLSAFSLCSKFVDFHYGVHAPGADHALWTSVSLRSACDCVSGGALA